MQRRILSGRCISPISCPSSSNHLGFFTIYDGDFEKYIQDFAEKTSFAFDSLFPRVEGAPPTPVAKNAHAFYEWAWRTTISPSGSTAPTRASGSKTSEPSWPIASHNRPPRDSTDSRVHQLSSVPRSASAEDCKSRGAAAMRGPGLLRRLHGRARHGPPGAGGDSPAPDEAALDLADIQGFVLRGYRMPMVRHFLLAVRDPGTSAQATRTARERRRIRRPADHHCRGLARGVRARTGRQSGGSPASHARLLPQRRDHLARAGGAGDRGARPDAVVHVIWCVHRRGRATRGVDRRHRSKLAPELGRRLRQRRRSRPGDAARHHRGSDGGLQRQVVCLVCRRRCLSRTLAPGRDGVDGDAEWPTGAYRQDSTSDIPTGSVRPPFAAARSTITPITSSPASHGSSCCGKTL